MENFVVRAELASPVIAQGWLTLDAVLAAQIYANTGDVARAHSEIPLSCTDGLWNASAALFESSKPAQVQFIASLRAQHDLDTALIARVRGSVIQSIGAKRRREFGNVMSQYPARQVRAVWWFGSGNIDAVRALLADVHFLGKKHAQGYGEISRMDIDAARCDGLKDDAGYPLRPIPKALWDGQADAIIDAETWRPAYFDTRDRALCVVPESVERDIDQLESML